MAEQEHIKMEIHFALYSLIYPQSYAWLCCFCLGLFNSSRFKRRILNAPNAVQQ